MFTKLVHASTNDHPYFVTFRTANTVLSSFERGLVSETILFDHGKILELAVGVIMPDHVHLLFRLCRGSILGDAMKRIKGVSARKVNISRGSRGRVWQDGYFDKMIGSAAAFESAFSYIVENPILAGLADDDAGYTHYVLPPETVPRT